MSEISHYDLNAMFAVTGATGIRHRAGRAIYERAKDARLALQLVATANEIEANPAHAPVANELRRLAAQLDTAPPSDASPASSTGDHGGQA